MSDQVVQTAVDVTALSGIELRKAVATALGWTGIWNDSPSRIFGHCDGWGRRLVPHFESSLDACFAPGGPVERLREDGHVLIMKMDGLRDGSFSPVYTVLLDNEPRMDGDALPALVCRAFLKAVSERGQ